MRTRRELMEDICREVIREAYLRSQPCVDIEKFDFENDPDKETTPFYDRYYLPPEVQSQLLDDVVIALNAGNSMSYDIELVKSFLKEGGHKQVYKPIVEGGTPCRTYEDTPKLEDVIGKENAEKALELVDLCGQFYNSRYEENFIRSCIFSFPTSNPDTVIKYWNEKGIVINIDDNVYKNDTNEFFDYSYKDYINGKYIDEDDFQDDFQEEEEETDESDNSDLSKDA